MSDDGSSVLALKAVVGMTALVVLAYLGGHERIMRLQQRLGVSGVITAGFPFVALGAIAASEQVGVLDVQVIDRLQPALQFGLGWIGFIVGAQLDIRTLDRVPRGTAYTVFVEALGPFSLTIAGCAALLIISGESWQTPELWRDLVVLGTAAAMTALRVPATRSPRSGIDAVVSQLDEIAGVVGLLFLTAYFRDGTISTWRLPDTAWIFVSLGLGVALGVVVFVMVRVPRSNAEFLAVLLGGIAFASGVANHMGLSPIVVCCLVGVLVTNFPNEQRDSIFGILRHLERPLHLLFLIVAGAVWDASDWRGWALVPVFMFCRIGGKVVGLLTSRTQARATSEVRRRVVTPMSGLSIALVISVASSATDSSFTWGITTIIGGSIVTEILVQLTSRDEAATEEAP